MKSPIGRPKLIFSLLLGSAKGRQRFAVLGRVGPFSVPLGDLHIDIHLPGELRGHKTVALQIAPNEESARPIRVKWGIQNGVKQPKALSGKSIRAPPNPSRNGA